MFSSQHANELKKWINNNEAVTDAIPEHLQSISNTKELEVALNTEDSTLVGLQWTVTDDGLQVCIGINKKVETLKARGKILSQKSSVFDPIGWLTLFSVTMRRLLKNTLIKIGQH